MKWRLKIGYLLLAIIIAGMLSACGDDATPIPATPNSSNNNAGPVGGTVPNNSSSDTSAAVTLRNTAQALSSITDYAGTLDITFTGQGAGSILMDVAMKGNPTADDSGKGPASPQFKGTVTKSTFTVLPANSAAVLGQTAYLYDPTSNVVLKGSNLGSSDIYNLFSGTQTRAAEMFSLDFVTPAKEGEETIGTYNTTKLTFTPKPDREGTALFGRNVKATVWVDKATNLPVQLDYSEDGAGLKWTVSNLQVNKGVDDTKLAFIPPTGAQVIDATQFGKIQKATDLTDANSKAGFTFPTVSYLPGDLPKAATSVSLQTTPVGNFIIADYSLKTTVANPTPFAGLKGSGVPQNQKSVSIKAFKSAVNLPANLPTTATITNASVQGQKATLAALTPTSAILIFNKSGVFYTISSTGYSKDEVQKVAEGLK